MSETRKIPTPEPRGEPRLRRLFWLVPVLTFVAGLLLGGGVIAATRTGGDDRVAATSEPDGAASASPVPEGDRTIAVPASCADGLDRAKRALEAVDGGFEALRELDTARLQKVLDDLQGLEPEVTRLADACRTAVTDGN